MKRDTLIVALMRAAWLAGHRACSQGVQLLEDSERCDRDIRETLDSFNRELQARVRPAGGSPISSLD